MQKSFEHSQEVEELNEACTQILDSTESQLIEFYNRFTTVSNQLLLVFYLSEIKGNLKRAHQFKSAHIQSGMSEYFNSKNMFIEVFS